MNRWALTLVPFAAMGALRCSHEPGCSREVPCTTDDADAQDGDLRFVFTDRTNRVIISTTQGFQPGTTAEYTPTGGEVVLGPAECPDAESDATCAVTLKRLRIELPDFTFALTNGHTVHVEQATVSLEAPVQLVDNGTEYLLARAASVHTCARLDGTSWHGSAETEDQFRLRLDTSRRLFDADYVVPMALRGDDTSCSATTVWARVTVEGR